MDTICHLAADERESVLAAFLGGSVAKYTCHILPLCETVERSNIRQQKECGNCGLGIPEHCNTR